MTDINLKTLTPDTSLPTTGFLFGADSQASTNPSVYSTQTVATTLLGSTSLTGDVLTTSVPVLNLTQQWNSVGTTFTGLKFNVDTTTYNQSAAASLLMDLQVGAVSKFKVDKAGNAYVGNPAAGFSNTGIMAVGAVFGTGGGNPAFLAGEQAVFYSSSTKVGEYIFGTRFKNNSAFTYEWSSTSVATGATDLTLSRKGAANLQLGAADAASPVAQTLSVQSIVGGLTGTPNLSAAAYPFTITGAQGTGTGAGGSIVFQVAPAGGSGTAQNALVEAFKIGPDANTFTFGKSTAATPIINMAAGGTGNTGYWVFSAQNVADAFTIGGFNAFPTTAGSSYTLGTSTVGFTGFTLGTTTVAGITRIFSDASNTLAQRNGTNAQALNIYNTYTSSTSFERYSIDWITTANLAIVGPNKGSGGGTQRVQRLSYLEDGGSGSTVALLGSTCPAASGTVKSWIKIITSDGTTAYIPCWA